MKILKREKAYKGYYEIDKLQVETEKGNIVNREVMIRKDAVCAIVYDTTTKHFIFVEQWRPGCDDKILEVPAGTLDVPGEDPEEAMKREIDEEIGYETDKIDFISECYTSPGGTTEKLYIYCCEVSNQIHEGGGLENEDINVFRIHRENLKNYRFTDAKTIIAVNFAIAKYNLK